MASLEDLYPAMNDMYSSMPPRPSDDIASRASGMVMDETPSAALVRAQLAQGDPAAIERGILEAKVRGSLEDRAVTGIGPVPEMKAGRWDDPKTYVQLATIPIGGVAAGAGAGARGIATFATRQAAVEGLKDLGESMFSGAGAGPTMMDRIGRLALGVAGAGGTVAASAGENQGVGPSGLTQEEIKRDYQQRADEYARRQKATSVATVPPGWTFNDVISHPDYNNPAAFKKQFGMLPEDAMNVIQNRSQSHPTGTFRRGF